MSGIRRAPQPSPGRRLVASSPWIVVFAGVVVMVVLLIVALGTYRGRSPAPDAGAEPYPPLPLPQLAGSPTTTAPASPTPPPPALPGLSPRATGLPTRSPAASRTSAVGGVGKPLSTRSSTPPAPPRPPAMTGRYGVVETFDGGFIAEVLISNGADEERGWTVWLAFPGGRLVTAWVEGAPQGTVRKSDGGFSYTSGADVPAGGSATLRFYIEGATTRPSECTVDGFGCAGV
jgi:hypothetical protein